LFESTTTPAAVGLSFTAKGGKRQGAKLPNRCGFKRVRSPRFGKANHLLPAYDGEHKRISFQNFQMKINRRLLGMLISAFDSLRQYQKLCRPNRHCA
jgi:hypothetical protein